MSKDFRSNYKKNNNSKKAIAKKKVKDIRKGNLQDAFVDDIKMKYADKFPQNRASAKNDPRWYFKSPQLLQDVASFSYSKPLGTYVKDLTNPGVTVVQDAAFTSIPGLLSETLLPIPGISKDENSPLNIAAQNVYSFIRYKNSGGKNYDAPDLMMYFLAMDNIYAAWNWAKRLYGMASTYSQVNKYMPKVWFNANYVDFDDVVGNLADFRASLNLLANKISAFAVPAVFNYMVRHSWLFANIYVDSETRKAQQYMFVPAGFYRFSETTSDLGGELLFKNLCARKPSKFYDHKAIIAYINDMVDALVYSEDIGVMSGDVIKAYGEGNLFKISEIEPDYKIEPVYRREVLSQIENSYFSSFGDLFNEDNAGELKIWQDPNTNFIKFNPKLKGTITATRGKPTPLGGMYLNFHWDSPTPEDVMEATRLNLSFESTSDATNFYVLITDCGTEIAVKAEMFWFAQKDVPGFYYDPTKPLTIQSVEMTTLRFVDFGESTTHKNTMQNVLKAYLWNSFDWAPQLMCSTNYRDPANTGTTWPTLLPFRDWDVYTYLSQDNVFAINQLALLSMFDVPN